VEEDAMSRNPQRRRTGDTYTVRLFGTNSLKEEAMWRIDLLLSSESVNMGRC
jgi:hypothetical protein